MEQMDIVNLVGYLQKELGEGFEVSKELNNNIDDLSTPKVVVKQMSGEFYDDSLQIPHIIEIYTEKPAEMLKFFTEFGKAHNNKKNTAIANGMQYDIIQTYNSPQVMENDFDLGLVHGSRLVMLCTIFVMYNLNDIKEVFVNGEKQEVLDTSITYSTELNSNRESGKELSTQNIKTATTAIQMSMISKINIFTRAISQIRQGHGTNQVFNIVLVFTDDSKETYNMVINQSAYSHARGKLPSTVVSLVNADEESEEQ